MKVALHAGQLLQPTPGGIGRYVHRLAERLPEAGIDANLFGAGPRPAGLPATVPWHDLGWPRGSWRYELWHRLRRPVVRAPGAVVHAPSLAIPPVEDRPLVVSVHDVAFLRHPEAFTRRGRAFHRRGLDLARRHATIVLTSSEFTRSELEREGFAAATIHTIPHGADPSAPLDEEELESRLERVGVRGRFVLSVGTIEPRKNYPAVVAAVRELRRRGRDVELVVAGAPGWGSVPDLDDSWIHAGRQVDDTTLAALYQRAVACCQLSSYEGFGLPALEAMARGCPVVVPDGGALAEVVGSGGIITRGVDADRVATLLEPLLDDENERSTWSARASRRARDFSWSEVAGQHAQLYHSLVDSRG